jgi:type II secretory pathway component PulF
MSEINRILGIDLSFENWMSYLTENEQIQAKRLSKHLHSINVMVLILKSKLNTIQRNSFINQIYAYPVLLYFLSLNLLSFVILTLIPSTYASIQIINQDKPLFLLKFLQFFIGLEWGALILILFLFSRFKQLPHFQIYMYLFKRKQNNLITLWQSHIFVSNLHYLNQNAIPLHTAMKILSESSTVIQKNLALNIHNKLEQGASLHESFDYLDEQLRYTLSIEDFERQIDDRLERYLHILEKQIRFNLKRFATLFSAFVYTHIGLMVILVYSTLLYPLQLLEQVI